MNIILERDQYLRSIRHLITLMCSCHAPFEVIERHLSVIARYPNEHLQILSRTASKRSSYSPCMRSCYSLMVPEVEVQRFVVVVHTMFNHDR
jgi:hypothetical protein